MKRHILLAGLLFNVGWGQNVFADEDLVAEPSTQTVDEGVGIYRSRQFVNLTLGIEQDVTLPPLPPNVEFKGGFRKIVTAAYSKALKTIRLTPKLEGFETLTIHDKRNGKIVAEYRIDVKKSKLDKVVREMRALLGDIEGINIKIVNNRVLVDGQILLPRDLARIYNVTQQFGDQARSIVTLSPLAQKKIAEFIARDINNPEIEVRTVNDNIILQGFAASEEESKRAELIARTYLPDLVIDPAADSGLIKKRKPTGADGIINLIQIKEAAPKPPAKMIQLVVHYVELLKDYSKSFKFQFTPGLDDGTRVSFQSGDGGGGIGTSITGTIYSLLPKLNWAKQHGHARVLESTSLIVEDGKKGEIKQVTDQPYPVIGKDGTQGTAFASVGIVTSITPTLLGEKSGSINMVMNFEVSSMAGQAAGAPIVSRNQMSSTITVRDRQSAAVGGLIRNASNTGYNRPGSDIKNPIISLYASKDFIKQQSQFVVFVTPVIKTSASSGAEQIKKKFRLRD